MLTLNAPAKINWFLNVYGKRDDGYHNIHSLMQFVTLTDSISFEYSDRIEVIADFGIPATDNLVYKAAVLLKEACVVDAGVKITLRKEIAISAGLGGGSSDAAFTLSGLNRLWGLNLSNEKLMDIGARLGSDVPFFLSGPAAVVEGRGEIVSPVRLERSHTILLVKPPVDISSAWAYTEFDRTGHKELTKEDNNIKLICQIFEKGDFSLLSSMLRNDLEPYVIGRYPVVGEIKNNLLKMGAKFSAMSGSGPTIFSVFEHYQGAAKAMESMSSNWCRIVKTVANNP